MHENDSQPKYDKASKHRHNVEAYKAWQPEPDKPRDPFKEAKIVSAFMQTKEYQDFVVLVGEEVARKLLTNSVIQAAKDTFK